MNTAPIFDVCNQDAAVTGLLKGSDNILRVFQFGQAPQKVAYPYAVWQLISGSPENYLSCRPNLETHTIMIDVYAKTAAEARKVANAIEYAIETHCYIVSYNGESIDPETKNNRSSFTVDWQTYRKS